MRTIVIISLVLAVAACDKNDGAAKPAPSAAATPVGSSTISSVGANAKPVSEIAVTTANPQALEAYKLGFDQLLNAHLDQAREQFKKATSLDPKFVSAMGMEGAATPGADGVKKLADANAQAAALPESERLHLQLEEAFANRDTAKAVEVGKKLADAAPAAWTAHLLYGRALTAFGKREEAQLAFKKATELDPTAGLPFNDLAYNELTLGKADDAVTHFKKYVDLAPKEANAQDSLGEALLMTGKYDDAEAAYKKAIDLDAKFIGALQGLGMVRFYKGDWTGAYDALGKLRDAAPTADEKGWAFHEIVWGQLAQNKAADAAKTLDAWDAEVAKAKDDSAAVWVAMHRAGVALETKKEADALKQLVTLGDKIDKLEAPAAKKLRWKAYLRTIEIIAESRLSKKAEADKTLAATQELLGKSEDAELKGLVAFAQGEAALAKGDAKAAADAFVSCGVTDDYCVWERSKALDKAGDKTGAAAARDKLQKTHRRDGMSFYAWTKTAPAAAPTAAAAPAATDAKK